MNKKELFSALHKLGIKPNKKLGQNFLVDSNVTKKLIKESRINKGDKILEIGAGLGALTGELIKYSSLIHAYEIDSILFKYLQNTFSGITNLKLHNEDILKAEVPYCNKVVSNIPYTITGPIFEKIFYNENPPYGFLIIERNIADRLSSTTNYKNRSRISISFNSFLSLKRQISIPSKAFFPVPMIDLSLIVVEPIKIHPFLHKSEQRNFFLKFVAGTMPYKNKNTINAIILFLKNSNIKITKEVVELSLTELKLFNKKIFELNVTDFIELSKFLFEEYYEDK